ncbi:MAG TPA: glycosyltransferase family 39 protein [Candidatus Hydrogenedentes bacterium]|nr:glycosyltransferase family 39 protein [Candidatus Hydrogenedentota bacterium]
MTETRHFMARPAGRGLRLVCGIAIMALGLWPLGPLGFLPITLAWPMAIMLGLPWAAGALKPRLAGNTWEESSKPTLEATGLCVIIGTFLLLKTIGIRPSTTDENIYFYGAYRFSQGAIPYRDFFFAHPPMHLVIPAAVFLLTGFNIVVAKLIPVVATLASGLFLYLTLRRTSGRVAALAGLAGFLSAYQVLMSSTHMTGINLTLAFLAGAVYFAVSDRPLSAGVFAGLSMATGIYAFAGVLALAVALLCRTPRKSLRFAAALAVVFGAIMGIFWILGGDGFIDGVFRYHFMKLARVAGQRDPFASLNPLVFVGAVLTNLGVFFEGDTFLELFYYHAPFFLATLLAVVGLGAHAVCVGRSKGAASAWRVLSPRHMLSSASGMIEFSVVAVLLFTIQWANLREIYDFYLTLSVFFVVIPFGVVIHFVYSRIQDPPELRSGVLALGVLLLLWIYVPFSAPLLRTLWTSEDQNRGEVKTYAWQSPVAFGRASELARALYFKDRRVAGAYTPYYRHYLWNKMLTFSTVDEVANYVTTNTTPDETITGASTIAPLVALYAHRRLAADEADTNYKRFESGLMDPKTFFYSACADQLRILISVERSFFTRAFMTSDPIAKAAFEAAADFHDPKSRHGRDMAIRIYQVREPGCGLFQ